MCLIWGAHIFPFCFVTKQPLLKQFFFFYGFCVLFIWIFDGLFYGRRFRYAVENRWNMLSFWIRKFQLWFLTAFGMLILNFCFSSSVDTVPNVIPINPFSVSHTEKNPNRLCLFTDTLIPMLFTLLQFHVNNSCVERKNKRTKANKKWTHRSCCLFY